MASGLLPTHTNKENRVLELLTSAKHIRGALRALRPNKIAVAYIGREWADFVQVSGLTDVIVSPTLGSNPGAIAALMKCPGVKVHFLDNLHSKIYIGNESVLVGSCNLSNSALGEGGLHEVAIRSNSAELRHELLITFDQYLKEAAGAYPNEAAKLRQLERLKDAHKRAQEARLLLPNRGVKQKLKAKDLLAYRWDPKQRIHIGWWSEQSSEGVHEDLIRAAIPGTEGQDLDDYINCWIDFKSDDGVEPGDWVLSWRCTANGRPHKTAKFEWMRADAVVPNASGDTDYPTSVIEIEEPGGGEVPFELSGRVSTLLRELLMDQRFKSLRPTSNCDSDWSLPSQATSKEFFMALRRKYAAEIKA